MRKWIWWLALALLAQCAAGQTINGSGATFPYPVYSQWFESFQKSHRGIEINYDPTGSGNGIRELLEGKVDFGASDMPMTDDQLAEATAKLKSPVVHFPTVLGAAVQLQRSGLGGRPEVHRGGSRRHFPRNDSPLGRPDPRAEQPRRKTARERHYRGAPGRGERHELLLDGLPVQSRSRLEQTRGKGSPLGGPWSAAKGKMAWRV